MKHGRKRSRGWNYRLTGVITVAFMLIAVLGFYLTQTVLLKNAQDLGNELANRYAEMELCTVQSAELLLTAGIWSMEDQIELGAGPEELRHWAERYFHKVTDASPGTLIPYAVIQGTLVTADDSGGLGADTNLNDIPWYQQALDAGGNLVTVARPDIKNGHTAITIARTCANTQNVLAFELFIEDWELENTLGALPEGSSYYLCDRSGNLLYAKTQLQVEPELLQQYIRTIFHQIQAGQLDDAQEYVYDLAQEKRAVYFHSAENGETSIITIPYSALLGDLRQVFCWVMSICGIAALFLLLMSIREYHLQKRLSRVSETVGALGNLYYSIYRVNWVQGTYEAIKSAEDIARLIPDKGEYDRLLEVIGQVIDQDTFNQFKSSFSLENVRRLVEENVSDFGGDFRRQFNGEYRWVNVRLLFDAALQHNEAILCFRQVEQEKIQQLQQLKMLEDALDHARESEASRAQFFSQMSHDMRTPLNVIMGAAELASRSLESPEKTQEHLKQIQVSAGHLLELINDILEMSRLEKTDLLLKNAPCDLQETVEQCLSAFQAQADLQHKTLELTVSLTHRRVYADAFRLQQILNNLVSNAMKFTQEGDRIQVELSQPPRQDQGVCCITVRDTGIGMSKEFLPKLFTPYARESRFGTQMVLGTGLGMAIVKTIVTRMGGQIQVESAPGQGTTITLTIPMEPAEEDIVPPEGKDAPDPSEVLRGKRILLAEDFEMNLEIASELLKLCGAEVTPARNGQEAVDIFRASEPGWFDVILMDMNMPVMDGCAAAEAIRALDRPDASIPILAVTANAFAEDVAATARAGMNAHIAKPIDLRQLACVLKELKR